MYANKASGDDTTGVGNACDASFELWVLLSTMIIKNKKLLK